MKNADSEKLPQLSVQVRLLARLSDVEPPGDVSLLFSLVFTTKSAKRRSMHNLSSSVFYEVVRYIFKTKRDCRCVVRYLSGDEVRCYCKSKKRNRTPPLKEARYQQRRLDKSVQRTIPYAFMILKERHAFFSAGIAYHLMCFLLKFV